jgi:haloalkane dehalogenase
MDALRTPDARFDGLPGFDFAPHYADVAGRDGGRLRVHYLDEGPADAPTVVLMHGEPSWCYLYRHMIPVLTTAGLRAVAPDLVGFGRTDKPTQVEDYTYERHVEWMRSVLFDALDLHDVTLVGQDWGGLIGLRLVGEHPERFARVVAANTFLPTGDGQPSEAFLNWRRFSQEVDPFPAGTIVNFGCTTELAPEVVAAYDAPFPNSTYVAGARQFPLLVPISPDDPAAAANRAAWKVLEQFDKPFLCAFSDSDPIMRGLDAPLLERIPGAAGQPHTTIAGGGHFLQEDRGPELAHVVVDFVGGTLS